MRLVFLGAPGTGKGTQAKLLAQAYEIARISTGDILREAVEKGSELGLKAKQYMNAGELVPDELMIQLVSGRLKQKDCEKGFILDGFPRTIQQAQELDKYLLKNKKPIDKVIYLNVDQDNIVKRLTSRRICLSCGKDYNLITDPPPENGTCVICGGVIGQRDDDKRETVVRRLEVYEAQTQPLKQYYQERGKLYVIDGGDSIEEVQKRIRDLFL